MATVEYSNLDEAGQRREAGSPNVYDAATDVAVSASASFVGQHSVKVRITGARAVCTKVFAAGTSVAVTLGSFISSSSIGTLTINLADFAVVGSSKSFTLPSGGVEVDANTAIAMTSTKSGSMTGNYVIKYDYEYVTA